MSDSQLENDDGDEKFDCTPPDVSEAANVATLNLLPTKSRTKYEKCYEEFCAWRKLKKISKVSENVLLAYFNRPLNYKYSTLWSRYSMLKTTVAVHENVDISRFCRLIALLKRKSEGYRAKKSKILFRDHIEKFLSEAPDNQFLMNKVALIFGIAGACRREELYALKITDVEDLTSSLLVTIRETKTKIPGIFTIVNNADGSSSFLDIIKKYVELRPKAIKHDRFFICYKNGKCYSQCVGKNTFGKIPNVIASFLKLPNPEKYTGHCFRRSSASLLADAGADIISVKRHGGWKSTAVAKGYIEDSIQNKNKIAEKILVGAEAQSLMPSSNMEVDKREENIEVAMAQIQPSNSKASGSINISNCNNCNISIHLH